MKVAYLHFLPSLGYNIAGSIPTTQIVFWNLVERYLKIIKLYVLLLSVKNWPMYSGSKWRKNVKIRRILIFLPSLGYNIAVFINATQTDIWDLLDWYLEILIMYA